MTAFVSSATAMADDSEVSLPKSTLQKTIKDLLPADMRVAGDAVDLLVQCCNEFVHLVSTQANEVSEHEKRSTINPEHIVRALEQLGFTSYLGDVSGVWEEWKGEKKEHQKLVSKKSAALDSGLTQEQLVELQKKLFEEARARTLSSAAGSSAAGQPPVQQEDAGQQAQQQQQAAAEQQPELGQEPQQLQLEQQQQQEQEEQQEEAMDHSV
ncbi:hypothetical protein N2152v2_007863 [Parachlorella kessleri]